MTAKKSSVDGKPNNVIRFEVHMGRSGEAVAQTLDSQQLKEIDLRSFTFCYAPSLVEIGYRDTQGNWHVLPRTVVETHKKKGRIDRRVSIGPVCWAILQCLQMNAGIGLTPQLLVELTGIDSLGRPGILAQRIRMLRVIFGEDKDTQRLILTSRNGDFTVTWPKNASWIWVFPIAPKAN